MFESIVTKAGQLFTAIPFTGATWFVLTTLFFFVWLFAKANKNPRSMVNWEDLIVDSTNNRASPYKVGYLIGVIVSTWIIVTMSDQKILNFDMLGMYLTYLVTGAGINTFSKRTAANGDTTITSSTVIQSPAPPPSLPSPAPQAPAAAPSVTITTTTAPAPQAPPAAPIVPIILEPGEDLPKP